MEKLTLEAVFEYDKRQNRKNIEGITTNIEELLDNLEIYTAGRLKEENAHITVEVLQDYIDSIRNELSYLTNMKKEFLENDDTFMTYEKMMEIGRESGLFTVGDCYDNIMNHAGMFFQMEHINEALLKLQKDICKKNPTEFKKAFSVSDDLVHKWNSEQEDMER